MHKKNQLFVAPTLNYCCHLPVLISICTPHIPPPFFLNILATWVFPDPSWSERFFSTFQRCDFHSSSLRFDNFGSHHFWSHPWEIKNQCIVGDVVWHLDKPMKLQSREPSPTITNPPKKMIYIYIFFFSRNQWNCLRPFNNWGWYTIIWTKNRTPKQDGNRVF